MFALSRISRCVGVSSPYLANVLCRVAREGMVETKRGSRGGYRMVRSAESIRRLDIVQAVGDVEITPRCMLGMARCSDERACPVDEYGKATRQEIATWLASIRLVDLARIEEFQRLRRRTALADDPVAPSPNSQPDNPPLPRRSANQGDDPR